MAIVSSKARTILKWLAPLVVVLASMCSAELLAASSPFSTLTGKHVVGYQGWFGCPSDPVSPGWGHWVQGGQALGPKTLHVDLWPDLSGFDKSELCPTGMTLPSGAPAYVFSSENAETVRRHFRWMRQYNIDGAAIQRFVGEIAVPSHVARFDRVLRNIRTAAEAEGRGFFVMYDVSGANPETLVATIEGDWTRLTQVEQLTASPSYMRHRGRPVVGLWGLGVVDRKPTAAQAMALIHFFKQDAKVTLLGGVPAYWRTLGADSRKEPEWADVYRGFDILSPWTVGRFATPAQADAFARTVMTPDIALTRTRGQDYMPVIFPGYSAHNELHGKRPLGQIPRLCGAFYREQADNAVKLGATMLYSAMFDELDEGTALMKVIRKPDGLPVGAALLAPDAAQCDSGSDLYLRLAGHATEGLHKALRR